MVPPAHASLEERLGQPFAASTVFRILARHGWRKVELDRCHPKRDAQVQEEFRKKSLKRSLAKAAKKNVLNLPLRVMFQDEARFGRLSDPKKFWAPAPLCRVVAVAIVREYPYAHGVVTPQDGAIDWILSAKMDTLNMGAFLDHVSNKHLGEFALMALDGAPSHRTHNLRVPDNMALVRLSPYSPELNPAERLWDELR